MEMDAGPLLSFTAPTRSEAYSASGFDRIVRVLADRLFPRGQRRTTRYTIVKFFLHKLDLVEDPKKEAAMKWG